MATSQSKKRKSRSGERYDSRRSGKKRREDDRSLSKSRRTGSSRSSHSSSAGKRKVRSISELVKLVISGEVNVPKSLTHFVGDSHQLLDQVFTILSESDVKGMLPDILKGLRMKQVKQLCLDQLKNMSQEDITEILDPGSTARPINVDAAVLELLAPQTAGSSPGEDILSATTVSTASSSAQPSSSTVSVKSGEKTNNVSGTEGAAQLAEGSGREHGEMIKMETSPVTEGREKEGKSSVSDVSEDESMAHTNCSTQTMECDTTTEELSADQQELTITQGISSDSGTDSDDSSSMSELEDCWLCDFPEEVSEWARLQEIEFRRRALEAELRRADQAECKGERKEHHSGVDQGAGSEPAPLHDTGKIDKLEALELQMRQRALQSLLAKKKEQKP